MSVLKTSKNLEGTCHLLLCWGFGGTCLSASVRTCLSASEFSVYFYYYYILYTISSKLSFVVVLRQQHACQLLNSLSMYFYYFIQNIGMDVCTVLTDPFLNLHLLPVVSAYLTPSSQLPSFPTKIIDIGSNSNVYLLKCTSLFLSNAGNYSIDVSVSPWSISPQS